MRASDLTFFENCFLLDSLVFESCINFIMRLASVPIKPCPLLMTFFMT